MLEAAESPAIGWDLYVSRSAIGTLEQDGRAMAGVEVVRLQLASDRASKVRAVLHPNGSGSVKLSAEFRLPSFDDFTAQEHTVVKLMKDLGYRWLDLETYGNIQSRAIFRGGGPFMLPDSPNLTAEALRRLGFLDDGLNGNLAEAMLVFANLSDNKNTLRRLGMLPDPEDKSLDVERKLRSAFLSTASPGKWCRNETALSQKVLQTLERADMLPQKGPSEYSHEEIFEAMKSFVSRQKLPRMHTFNGLRFRIRRYIERKNPSMRKEALWCVAVVTLLRSTCFVQAPARTLETQQLRALETATLSTGLSMAGALPAFATWGEGSEPGQNIDPDSTEYYNRKVLNATAICLTFAVFLFGLVVSQARKLVENKWLN
ncbi:unnamed protein product [Cladocopium goreaui]|uniref:Uncharacterized protein n=2 Tax=Cladocopium goreaui TaxID=2562237 RepID=A0A9P1FRN8_9DINO|nr:unnamed protein product [Cladocopium goreaui]